MTNLDLWNKYRRPPEGALKRFTRPGGFRGTSIDPMWMYEKATEEWGEYGVDWKVDILNEQVIPFETDGRWLHYIIVSVRGATGVGCTMLRYEDKHGWKVDEEAPKKSFTDAVTNALSRKGFGADIYMGRHDGNKYIDEPPPAAKRNDNPKETETLTPLAVARLWSTPAKRDFIELIARGVNAYGRDEFEKRVVEKLLKHGDYNAKKISEIDFKKDGHRLYDDITNMLKAHKELEGEEK